MRSASLLIGVFVIMAIIAIAFICQSDSSESTKNITVKPLNGLTNLHKFLNDILDGKVLEMNSNDLTKPGDQNSSEIRGIQVKFMKNNNSNEVMTKKSN